MMNTEKIATIENQVKELEITKQKLIKEDKEQMQREEIKKSTLAKIDFHREELIRLSIVDNEIIYFNDRKQYDQRQIDKMVENQYYRDNRYK